MTETGGAKNVTIYDIAARAETSPSTVGAVLNGTWRSRRISEKRAKSIQELADEMGYSVNMQASALRRERSHIVGMIVPMYDNRYFSSISQLFEQEARNRDLFPMVSCTLRDPDLEIEAVRLMLNYQVERVVCTGATDPDRITELCAKRGVPTYNLDLPGSKSPSIISDNYKGAFELTSALIERVRRSGALADDNILFIGGRATDHNTQERVRGFVDAHKKTGLEVKEDKLLTLGYAAETAEKALDNYKNTHSTLPAGIFVNSTISLEGVTNWFKREQPQHIQSVSLGCFDWDPFATFIARDMIMVRQDVPKMMTELFKMIDGAETSSDTLIEIPPAIILN